MRIDRPAPLFLVFVALTIVAGGAQDAGSPAWTDEEGRPLPYSRTDAAKGSGAGLEAGAGAARFDLAQPFHLEAPGAIAVDLDLDGPARVEIEIFGMQNKSISHFELEAPDPAMTLVFPVTGGVEIEGVGIGLATPADGAATGATLRALRFVPAFRGFSKSHGRTTLSPGLSLFRRSGRLVATIDEPFAGIDAPSGYEPALALDWRPGSALGTIALSVPGARLRHIAIRPGAAGILLPRKWFGEDPKTVEFDAPAALDIVECSARSISADEASVLDLGVVLDLARSPSDRPFDVYRWDAKPSVLVFVFSDYAAQDAALKRLAFFVEKAGYRGRLASDAELAPLHGWNAHDYRASDLSDFFEKARASGFRLDESELAVRSLLLGAGVIRESGGAYVAGEGALISISKESPAYLRSTFMAHEASHGLYFTDPEFADFVRKTWGSVDKDERWFWKLYFGWMNYDTKDEDLMANEFMAYLLQQPNSRVEDYFTKILPSRVLAKHADLEPRVDEWMARYGSSFSERAAALEAWLHARYGFVAARPWSLY